MLNKIEFLYISLVFGITFNVISCTNKTSVNFSDDQIESYVLCVNGYRELQNRGEDVRAYQPYILQKYGKEFIEKFRDFSKSVDIKTKSCPKNITIVECAKRVNLDKQESLFFTLVEGSDIANKTKSLGDLKAETSLLCLDLKKLK